MNSQKLFVSFWNIGLDNLPEGTFRRRSITGTDAKFCIEQVRQERNLFCVSDDDLFAPYKKRQHDNHAAMCELLTQEFGIRLSLDDFCSKAKDRDEDGDVYFINALSLAEVGSSSSLLVITCAYGFAKRKEPDELPAFDISPDTVQFHLIECVVPRDA